MPTLRRTLALAPLGLALLAPAVSEASPARGEETLEGGNFGLGVMAGNPTALSGKWFINGSAHALQFGAGWGFWGPAGIDSHLRVHLDWVWHPGTFVSNDDFDLVPYIGFGIGSGMYATGRHRGNYTCDGAPPFEDDFCDNRHRHLYLFGRPLLGMAFHWTRVPLDTFIEAAWAPGLRFDHDAVDPLFLLFDFAIGARWYFG